MTKAQLQTVKNGEDIARAAKDLQYNAALVAEGMRAAAPDELLTAAGDWRTLSAQCLEADTALGEIVGTGKGDARLVRAAVEYIRSKCRLQISQNAAWTEPQKKALRERYFIGVDVFADEATAGQSVESIIDHAAADALPAITPAKIATYRAQLDAYTGKPGAKTQGQSAATTLRGQRRAKFTQVMNLRHEIQHPADDAYPWQAALSQGPRTVFKLPAGRPFTG